MQNEIEISKQKKLLVKRTQEKNEIIKTKTMPELNILYKRYLQEYMDIQKKVTEFVKENNENPPQDLIDRMFTIAVLEHGMRLQESEILKASN
jgi:hypothetical protein